MNPSNKYGSRVDSFAAFDLYNKPMPVLPPADLTIVSTAIAPSYMSFRNSAGSRVVDFNPLDNPYIRGLSFTSNLADGLVDGASSHDGAATSWQAVLVAHRVSLDLTGSVSNTAGTALIDGTGTVFTREVAVGATLIWIDDNGVQRSGVVLTVNADSGVGAITLTSVTASTVMFTGNTTQKKANLLVGKAGYAGSSITIPFLQMNMLYPFAFFIADATVIYTPAGRIITVAGSTTVTGVGTSFQTDMGVGAAALGYVIGWTDDLGVRRTGVVASVASQTSLTLTAVVVAGGSGTSVPLINLDAALRIQVSIPTNFFAYTITIDPAFGNGVRRLSLAVQAEIEHTFAMSGEL